jgi:hypothetical protein
VSHQFSTVVFGDTTVEGDEHFHIEFSNLVNVGKEHGGVANNQAQITLLNDD